MSNALFDLQSKKGKLRKQKLTKTGENSNTNNMAVHSYFFTTNVLQSRLHPLAKHILMLMTILTKAEGHRNMSVRFIKNKKNKHSKFKKNTWSKHGVKLL